MPLVMNGTQFKQDFSSSKGILKTLLKEYIVNKKLTGSLGMLITIKTLEIKRKVKVLTSVQSQLHGAKSKKRNIQPPYFVMLVRALNRIKINF